LPQRIYLDHAATSPLRPEAKAAMEEGFRIWANPSSPHAEGRKARAALEDARERIKRALGWEGELIFTSGASEALAIGLGRAKADRRIVSAVEHDAVFRAAPDAEVVPVGARGAVDPDALADLLAAGGTPIVAIQHVNSETGSIQEISDIAEIVHRSGGSILSDCAQSAGKMAVPDGVDMAVLSGHKFGAPIGIGALLVKDFAMLEPTGGHERGYRAGTENLPGALGLAAALEPDPWVGTRFSDRSRFSEWFEEEDALGHASVYHIVPITHRAMSAQALLIRLDAMGFAVSAGSACSSGSLKPSRVLKAFGLSDEKASRTIRVSIGWNTTPEELDAFANAWKELN
jgi:cysteine desulfurase